MNKKILIGIVAAAIIPASVYAFSPLFLDTTIDEPLPMSMKESDTMMSDKMESDTMMSDKMESDTMMSDKMEPDTMMSDKMEPDTMMSDKMESDTMMSPKPVSGTFVGVGDGIHDAEGMAMVLYLDDGSQFLRLENFRSTNGPDLYVYLATDKDATDFVNLGRLKANIGNQNYELPQNADLERYDTVLIWCQQFSVLFGSAKLT